MFSLIPLVKQNPETSIQHDHLSFTLDTRHYQQHAHTHTPYTVLSDLQRLESNVSLCWLLKVRGRWRLPLLASYLIECKMSLRSHEARNTTKKGKPAKKRVAIVPRR